MFETFSPGSQSYCQTPDGLLTISVKALKTDPVSPCELKFPRSINSSHFAVNFIVLFILSLCCRVYLAWRAHICGMILNGQFVSIVTVKISDDDRWEFLINTFPIFKIKNKNKKAYFPPLPGLKKASKCDNKFTTNYLDSVLTCFSKRFKSLCC